MTAVREVADLPYFSDMQLDPAKFPIETGLPVGKPPYEVVPYGGDRAQDGSTDNTSDESDEEYGSRSDSSQTSKKHKLSPVGPSKKGFCGTDYKKVKITGGRPALAKKVTAELDSDDELIVKMKHAKYQEKEIAQRLIDEGRTHYHPKTIGTRWARIKKVMQERNDELLDQDLTDWHDGDDEVLIQAIARADVEVEKAKKQAEDKKWRIVAEKMKAIKPVVNFSHNACRKRLEALQQGTAKPTPESIANPDDEVQSRIQSRRDREEQIRATTRSAAAYTDNINGNAWTSKARG